MLSVLIVDDKVVTLNGLKNVIPWEQLDAVVVGEARNGRDALELAFLKRPDILITDIRMPIMDGLELCKKLHGSMPNIVKIILSAYSDFTYAQEALQYGVTDYVLKPIDHQKINLIIDKVNQVSKSKKTQQNYFTILYHTDLQERLFSALKDGNMDYISNFFENDFPEINSSRYELTMEWCLFLFNMLFKFTSSLELNIEAIGIYKTQKWSEIFTLKSNTEMRAFIKDLFLSTASFVSIKKSSHSNFIAEYIKDYINRNYSNPSISLDSIADELGLSPSYIGNVFHQVYGDSISKYISKKRMEKAIELLKSPSVLVTDITAIIGYNDPHYFARAFKKMQGITPSEYRNLSLNNNIDKPKA